MRKTLLLASALAALLSLPASAGAATAEEAAGLKTTLTPLGAEKAGNKEGTIPAWEGGLTKNPPHWKDGNPLADLFPNEKPILQITAKNADQHADKLSEGTLALLKKYPTYRVDVYPTHRTAAFPQSVYENTFKNATRAKLSADKHYFENAIGGVPFPIPADGYQALLNHRARPHLEAVEFGFANYVVSSDGKAALASMAPDRMQSPYYYPEATIEKPTNTMLLIRFSNTAPAYKAGEGLVLHDAITEAKDSRKAWQYLVGQRRVRRAPTAAYDTPDFISSGLTYFDELGVFFGAGDRYEWKLMGKKEMYVPYNINKLWSTGKIEDVVSGNHINPDKLRWELHRVWVLEGTLAPGKRHVVPKRRLYLDEDSWTALLSDGYDAEGKLWRVVHGLPLVVPDGPGLFTYASAVYNLQANTLGGMSWVMDGFKLIRPRLPDSFYTPEALGAEGVR